MTTKFDMTDLITIYMATFLSKRLREYEKVLSLKEAVFPSNAGTSPMPEENSILKPFFLFQPSILYYEYDQGNRPSF